jgi:RND family efflux transporter MFP subunit
MKRLVGLTICMLLIASLALIQCGKSGKTDQPGKPDAAIAKEKGAKDNGEKGKEDQEIDVDKLDIPDRMKEAIKSGRIPKDRVKQFLEMRKQGGNLPTVKIEPVKRQRINAFLVLNGVVEPERKVEVYSRLSAYVKQIVKEEGDFVKKDDVLALLDDTEISFSYRQAEIQLEQAKLTLTDEEVNYERSKKLKETDMISDQDFQAAQANYNKARLDYQTKLENFKDLELQLSYTKIKSPVEGYVTQRTIEVGTRVNSNQQVFTVEDFSPLLVKVYVPTTDVVNLRPGMESEVSTDVLGNMVFNGRIKIVNPRIDEQSGTVKVTIEVFDNVHKLKPGMFVETKILIGNKPDALVVPRKCITYKQNQAFVFISQRQGMEMQVNERPIKTGISEGDMVEVLEGLEEGERIVTVGVEGLKDNMKVRVSR